MGSGPDMQGAGRPLLILAEAQAVLAPTTAALPPLKPPKPAANTPKHYEPGDIVEHKVFGRGKVLKVKPAAGDQIVEINFEKVGVKKTMANFAPLTKITEE